MHVLFYKENVLSVFLISKILLARWSRFGFRYFPLASALACIFPKTGAPVWVPFSRSMEVEGMRLVLVYKSDKKIDRRKLSSSVRCYCDGRVGFISDTETSEGRFFALVQFEKTEGKFAVTPIPSILRCSPE